MARKKKYPMLPGETDEEYYYRRARERAEERRRKNGTRARKPKYPLIPGESKEDRERRLNRERMARYLRDPIKGPRINSKRKIWRAAHPETIKAMSKKSREKMGPRPPEVGRKFNLKRLYNLIPEQYDLMLLSQDGVCKICEQPETRIQRGVVTPLAVDHDHKTGKIRGLLCFKCNVMVGYLEDSRQRVDQAFEYLAFSFDPERDLVCV